MLTPLITVLQIGPFRKLWSAQLISQITINMLTFILGVFIYAHTKSNTAVSLLYFSVGLPAALFGVISGVYVDRFNKKKLLIGTTVLRAICILPLLFLRGQLLAMYALSALISVLSQFFIPAEASLIPRYIKPELLIVANSLFTLTFYSAIIGGFVVSGPLLELLGDEAILYLMSMFLFIATLILMRLPNEKETIAREKVTVAHLVRDLLTGFAFIKKEVQVAQAMLIVTLFQAVIAIFATLGPGFADRILALKLTDASVVILGPAALGMVGGAIMMGLFGNRLAKRKIITSSFLISGLLIVFIAFLINVHELALKFGRFDGFLSFFADNILVLSICSFFVLGVVSSMVDVSCNTLLQEKTTEQLRGRVYGVLASLISGIAILPVIVSAILADLIGIGKILLLIGIVLLGLSAFVRVKHSSKV